MIQLVSKGLFRWRSKEQVHFTSQRHHGLYFPGFGRNKCTAYLGICTEAKLEAKVLDPVDLLSYKNNLGTSPLGWLLCNLLTLIQNKQSNKVNYRMQV